MKKEEYIARYGKAAYAKRLTQLNAWNKAHPEEGKARSKAWQKAHPDAVRLSRNEWGRKGGKHYNQTLKNNRTGLRCEKSKVRTSHSRKWREYKNIIAPESQIHHEWIPDTSEFRGVALVEADRHMHGFVDVIEVLEGRITLLSEEEIKKGGERYDNINGARAGCNRGFTR